MRKGILTIQLFIAWILLSWPFTPEGIAYQTVFVGLVACVFSGMMFGEAFTESPHKFLLGKRYLWGLYYLPVFFAACVRANLQVAYLVLHPRLPIRPGIVKVKTKLRSRSGLTALANSITLTPGTMSVHVDPAGYLYIHWIYVTTEDLERASKAIVGQFEDILERIYE